VLVASQESPVRYSVFEAPFYRSGAEHVEELPESARESSGLALGLLPAPMPRPRRDLTPIP